MVADETGSRDSSPFSPQTTETEGAMANSVVRFFIQLWIWRISDPDCSVQMSMFGYY